MRNSTLHRHLVRVLDEKQRTIDRLRGFAGLANSFSVCLVGVQTQETISTEPQRLAR